MTIRDIIFWFGFLLVVVGGWLCISYMFTEPKLPQFYIVDLKYWVRMLPVAVGVIVICLVGSRE